VSQDDLLAIIEVLKKTSKKYKIKSKLFMFNTFTNFIVSNLGILSLSAYGIVGGSLFLDKLKQIYYPDPQIIAYKLQLDANQVLITKMSELLKEKSLRVAEQQGPIFYNLSGNSSSFAIGCACLLGVTAIIGICYAYSLSNGDLSKKLANDLSQPLKEHAEDLLKAATKTQCELEERKAQENDILRQRVEFLENKTTAFLDGFPRVMSDIECNVIRKIESIPSFHINRSNMHNGVVQTPGFSNEFNNTVAIRPLSEDENVPTSSLQITEITSRPL